MKKEIIDTRSLAHTKWNCKYHMLNIVVVGGVFLALATFEAESFKISDDTNKRNTAVIVILIIDDFDSLQRVTS